MDERTDERDGGFGDVPSLPPTPRRVVRLDDGGRRARRGRGRALALGALAALVALLVALALGETLATRPATGSGRTVTLVRDVVRVTVPGGSDGSLAAVTPQTSG